MGRGVVKRAFARISRTGLSKVDRATARYVQGSNQYLIIAVTSGLPFGVFFLLHDGGALWHAAIVEAAVIGVWLGCFALNAAGWVRVSSVLELAAPIVAFTALAWMLSYRAGFLLPMLLTASISFVTFAPKRLPWGMTLTVISTVAVAWSFLDPRFAVPRLDVSAGVVDGLLVGNIILVTVVMITTSGLNHYYFSRERRRAERQLETAQDQARTDPLTRLENRRGMIELLAAIPADLPYAVALLDLDRFKEVNDTMGHGRGDTVLTEVADVLKGVIGSHGVVARWGGEEFLVLMVDGHTVAAVPVVERARAAVEALASLDAGTVVTFSAGVALADAGVSWETAVRAADGLLYEAKGAGRNCVRHAATQRPTI